MHSRLAVIMSKTIYRRKHIEFYIYILQLKIKCNTIQALAAFVEFKVVIFNHYMKHRN